MCSVGVLTLLAFVAKAHVTEIAPQNSGDLFVDKLANNILDKLFDRGLQAASLNDADVDGTALGKPGTTLGKVSHLVAPSQFSIPSGRFRPVPKVTSYASQKQMQQQAEPEVPSEDAGISRRTALAGAVGLTSGLSLANSAQALDLALPGLSETRKIINEKMAALIVSKIEKKELDISPPDILRLVLHDALTWNDEKKTGGLTGSIRYELDRPENKGLAPVVKKLEALQKEVQAETGADVTFSDVMATAGNQIWAQDFKSVFCTKVSPPCQEVYDGFGNKPKPLALGRVDATGPDEEGLVPWTGASVEDFKKAFQRIKLGLTDLCVLAPGLLEDEAKGVELLMQDEQCATILKEQEKSKQTRTRTNYEKSFIDTYFVLSLRAPLDRGMYLPKA